MYATDGLLTCSRPSPCTPTASTCQGPFFHVISNQTLDFPPLRQWPRVARVDPSYLPGAVHRRRGRHVHVRPRFGPPGVYAVRGRAAGAALDQRTVLHARRGTRRVARADWQSIHGVHAEVQREGAIRRNHLMSTGRSQHQNVSWCFCVSARQSTFCVGVVQCLLCGRSCVYSEVGALWPGLCVSALQCVRLCILTTRAGAIGSEDLVLWGWLMIHGP